jgi:hypothetical protein
MRETNTRKLLRRKASKRKRQERHAPETTPLQHSKCILTVYKHSIRDSDAPLDKSKHIVEKRTFPKENQRLLLKQTSIVGGIR